MNIAKHSGARWALLTWSLYIVAPWVHADEGLAIVAEEAPAAVAEAPIAVGGFALQAVAAPVAAANNEDAQLEPFLQQYRPVLQAELSFANRVCTFTAEQKTSIIADAKQELKDVVRKLVKNNNQPQGIRIFWAGNVARAAQPNNAAGASFDKVAATIVKKHVSPEQFAAYEAEAQKRRDFSQQTVIDYIVAKIDDRLRLSPDQREAISKDLLKRWADDWAPSPAGLLQLDEYVPSVPSEAIVPHLDKAQKKVWTTVQTVSVQGFMGGGWENVVAGGQNTWDIDLSDQPAQPVPQPVMPAPAVY
jgi:hypothetical protein